MGWFYKKPVEPPPCECVAQPVIDRDNNVSEGDIWICDDCGTWWIVKRIDRNAIIRWREFDSSDINPGRNVHE